MVRSPIVVGRHAFQAVPRCVRERLGTARWCCICIGSSVGGAITGLSLLVPCARCPRGCRPAGVQRAWTIVQRRPRRGRLVQARAAGMLASLAVMAPAQSAASNARMTGPAMAGWPLASLVTRVQGAHPLIGPPLDQHRAAPLTARAAGRSARKPIVGRVPAIGTGWSPTTRPSVRHRPTSAPRRWTSALGAGALLATRASHGSGMVPPAVRVAIAWGRFPPPRRWPRTPGADRFRSGSQGLHHGGASVSPGGG